MESNGGAAWNWNIYDSCIVNDITTSFSDKKGGGNLYDVQTIGDISPQGLVLENPVVTLVQAENQSVAVAVEGFLTILEETGQVYVATVNLGCSIEALCFSPDGKIVIAADCSGIIHFVSVENGDLIFSHRIVSRDPSLNGNASNSLFCSVSCVGGQGGSCCVIVGLHSGRFFVFSNVMLKLLEKAFHSKNPEIGKLAQAKMHVQEYDSSMVHTKSMTGLVTVEDGFCDSFVTLGSGEGILALWQLASDAISDLSCEESRMQLRSSVKCDLFYNGNDARIVKAVHVVQHLYTLDCMGCLHQWNTDDLMLSGCWEDKRILDFTIKVSGFAGSTTTEKLFAILLNAATGQLELTVFGLPSMEQCYTCKCKEEKIYGLALASPFVENVVFVDGSVEFNSQGSHLSMHCVVEASPEDRLIRLLSNRRFDDAEKFATTFHLDLQQVYQQKALYLSNYISSIDETRVLEAAYKEFKDCLIKIKDATTVGEICLEAMIPDIQMSYELLALAGSRLRDVPARLIKMNGASTGDNKEHKEDLNVQIINRVDRLVTFRMIRKCGSEEGSAGEDWIRFCNSDLPTELVHLLGVGNIQAAAIVLLRHKASFLSFLEAAGADTADNSIAERRLQAFLDCIPETADVDLVVGWLESSVVPTVLSKLPCGLRVLSSWLIIRAESFEQSDPSGWPENGLKMANVLFNVQSELAKAGFLRDHMSRVTKAFKSTSAEVANLRLLASRLQLLLQLKQKYQCNITLMEFIQETTMSLTYRMLDRVMVPELILPMLEKTVRPYMREHSLNEEEVLLGYVEDLLSRFRDQEWGSVESLSERKVVSIIKCMKKSLMVLKATVKLAKRASVPWSQDVHDLVENGLKLCSTLSLNGKSAQLNEDEKEILLQLKPICKELEYSKHLERLPTILAEYGLSNVEMSSHHQIIRFLVCRDMPESLSQALHFCHTFTTLSDIDVYRHRLVFFLQSSRVADCVLLLSEVRKKDVNMALSLTRHAVTLAETMLNETDVMFAAERITYCDSAIRIIKDLLQDMGSGGDKAHNSEFEIFLKDELSILNNIVSLQTKYSEFVTVGQYVSKTDGARILSKHVMKLGLSAGNPTSVSVCDLSHRESKITSASDAGGADGIIKSDNIQTEFSHVLNVARILGVQSSVLQEQVASQMSKKGRSMAGIALGICKELLQISPLEDVAGTTLCVILELLRHSPDLISDTKLMPEVLDVATSALTFLDISDMGKAVQLNRFLMLANEVNELTDSEDDLFLCKQGSSYKNPFKLLSTLHPWMEQRGGLMLRPQQISPLLRKIARVFSSEDFMTCQHMMDDEKLTDSVGSLRQVALEMASAMQLGQQSDLGLQWLTFCLRVSLCQVSDRHDPTAEDVGKGLSGKLQAIIDEGCKILPEYVEDSAKKALGARDVDVGYTVGLLTMVAISQAHTLLQSELGKAASNYKKIMNITTAGIAMLKLNSLDSQVKKFLHLFLDSKWGETLRPLKISFEKVLFSPPNLKSCLLPNLLHHPEVTGKLISDFCTDYDLDRTAALLEFTRVLLSDPSCTISHEPVKSGMPGSNPRSLIWEETALVSPTTLAATAFNITSHVPDYPKTQETKDGEPRWNRPWEEVKKEIAYVINNIDDGHGMCRQLIRILRLETSPYYYKRIRFLLNLIADCKTVQTEVNVERGLGLIDCLKHVQRSSQVSEYERQHWNHNAKNYASSVLPAISKQRLPVHPLLFGDSSSAWKILAPELNECSAARLVPIAHLLSLNVNKLYVTAAENFVRGHMDTNGGQQLALTPQQLKGIREMTKEVDDFRMATAMAKRIAELLPTSATKVEAYEWCETISKAWLESMDESQQDYTTIVNMHRNLCACRRHTAIELVLQDFKLTGPKTNMLIPTPEKLICALYQHQSVIDRYYKPDAVAYPDIHQAADKIAEIHSVNIFKLRISISTDLLFSASLSTNIPQDDDMTANLGNMKAASLLESGSQYSSLVDDDFIRLMYILSHALTKQTAVFLLGFAFNRTNQRITNACRVRGLQCVLQLFEDELIEELTNEKVAAIRGKLRILLYLSELESVGFSIPGSRLQKGDKDGVARSILASPALRHSPRAVRVAAELCQEYDSWCPETWQMILQQLVSSRQIGYLRHLLPDVCCHTGISSLSCLPSVWQSCVTFPLAAMTPPLAADEMTVALESYHFLIACPVLLQVDLVGVAKHFVRIDLPLLALGCLLCDPSRDTKSRELATVQRDAIQDQLQQYPQILGRNQIIELLRECAV